MMELTCAFILIFTSLVSATPHGYGVKGGASARAESSASAGAFGDVGEIPVAVPLGTGYSGSFSKSSASSSSSSSASSSSSSSAFSYSGSGAGGLSGFGLNGAKGSSGCSLGNCQTAGANGLSASQDSSSHNTANAASIAGAGSISGSGCQGHSCDNNSEKCATGQCKPNTHTETPSIDSDTNECTSGQCGSTSQNDASPTEYGSNDIRVVSDSKNSAHNSKDQSSNFDKTSTAYNGAGSDCSQGKCRPSASFNSKANYGHDSENSYQGSDSSNKQHSSSSEDGITSNYHKPATHLETPKAESKCNSPGCISESNEPRYETSPSSYNVRVHYDGNNGQHSVSSSNSATKEPSQLFGNPSSGTSYNPSTAAPSLTVSPGFINFGQSPSNAPSLSVGCQTANCSPYPSYPGATAGSNVPSGHIGVAKPIDGTKPSNDKLPAYTGGFGGPTGLFKPNEFASVTPTGNPPHGHPSTQLHGPSFENIATGCSTPSCSGYPSSSGANGHSGTDVHKTGGTYTGGFGGPAGMLIPNDIHATVTNRPSAIHPTGTSGASAPTGSFGTTKPSNGISSPSEKLPAYTGGFGGPGGVLKPNDYNVYTTVPSSHIPSGAYNGPSSSNSAGCGTPNCYPGNAGASAAANAQAGSFGVSKPGIGPHHSSVTVPAYTSGYNKPSEVSKPNESQPSAPAVLPSFANTPGYSTGCKTANCAGYPTSGAAANTNLQSGSYGINKPNSGKNPSTPQYTGSFGGPSGTLKPNENLYATPSTGSYTPTDCKTSNCAYSPTAIGGATSGINFQSGSSGITKPSGYVNPSNEKVPTYTGGFGGASGLLKPNDYSVPAVGQTPHNHHNPSIPIDVSKPASCISGHCNPQVPHGSASHPNPTGLNAVHTAAAAAAEANAVAYTGGFGGPPGVLKPYDDGKIGAPPTNGGLSHGSPIGGHYSSPNTNIHSAHGMNPGAISGNTGQAGTHANAAAQAGSTAYSGAAAGAASGASSYGYNAQGSHYNQGGNTQGASPCGGGCGGTSGANSGGAGSIFDFDGGHSKSTASATAKSLAGANAFGVGGNFASSSASAHASAGAYTKGGYGKR